MDAALQKLVGEYRPSMTLDVVHSWAADVVTKLSKPVEPSEFTYADDQTYLLGGEGTMWEVRVVSSLDEFDWVDFEVRAKTPEEAATKAETVARRNPDNYFGDTPEPTYHAKRHDIMPIEFEDD